MKKLVVAILWLLSFNVLAVNEAFFKAVILEPVESGIKTSAQLSVLIGQNDQVQAKTHFGALVANWKQIETTYFLGDLNEDYLDTPRYIDIFHGNNEDIKEQLDLIIASGDDLSYALYKHSHKTINALEYILFNHDLSNPRVKAVALMMTDSIQSYLQEVLRGYQAHQSIFLKSEQYASAVLLNTLVAGTYKLKEWRIGDVAGLSKKYKGKPDLRRAEYYLSQNSMRAISTILEAHKQVIASEQLKDFGDVAREYGAHAEMDKALERLNQALKRAAEMDDKDMTSNKAAALYDATNALMQSYYIALMDRLGFVSKVLDADGD